MDGEGARPDLATALARVLAVSCQRDPELAAAVRHLCHAVLASLEGGTAPVASAAPVAEARRPPARPEAAAAEPQPVISLRELLATKAAAARAEAAARAALPQNEYLEARPAAGARQRDQVPDEELPVIAGRLRLKAEACRRVAARRREDSASSAVAEAMTARADADLLDQARDRDAYLWMLLAADRPMPEDPTRWDVLAACFEAAAAAAELAYEVVHGERPTREDIAEALQLLASAQSAVRSGIRDLTPGADRPWRPDRDQLQLHHWLETATGRENLYLRRHMRVDDPAEPSEAAALAERIAVVHARVQDRTTGAKRRRQALNRLKYHAQAMTQQGHAGEHDWKRIVESVDELVTGGVPPSDVEIREAILPALDLMPDVDEEMPRSLQLVLREVDRYLALRPAAPPSPETAARTRHPDVQKVADLLRGRKVVLIGGECRGEAREALERAFELDELVWISTREHQSIEGFIPVVARPDVVLVVLAIRWASHSFGDIRTACEAHGKALVRLPAGYGPNQVATQVLAQASRQIQDAVSAS